MLHTIVVKNGPRLRHLGQDSSALMSELSLGHFGASADLSGQFGPTKLVPKCPGSEVSVIHDGTLFCCNVHLLIHMAPSSVVLNSTSIYGCSCKTPHYPHLSSHFCISSTTINLIRVLICRRFRSGRPQNHIYTTSVHPKLI